MASRLKDVIPIKELLNMRARVDKSRMGDDDYGQSCVDVIKRLGMRKDTNTPRMIDEIEYRLGRKKRPGDSDASRPHSRMPRVRSDEDY